MRVLPLHRVIEVVVGPLDPDALVRDAAGAGVLDGAVGFDEEVGGAGEDEDGHFCSLDDDASVVWFG